MRRRRRKEEKEEEKGKSSWIPRVSLSLSLTSHPAPLPRPRIPPPIVYTNLQKKKKTTAPGATEQDISVSSPTPPVAVVDPAARRAGDRLFTAALSSLASNREDVLWVRLDNSYITDAKVEKLCTALQQNSHALSLDLSNNLLTDAGVIPLCAALAAGAASDLIELRLNDNPIGEDGMQAVLELASSRKTLRIDSGMSPPPVAAAETTSPSHGQPMPLYATTGTGTGTTNGMLADSAIVRKYFQVGNDDDDDDDDDGGGGASNALNSHNPFSTGDDMGGSGGHEMVTGMDPEQLSVLLWDQVRCS